jgi:integrase
MAMEYSKMFGKIVRRATVPEAVTELLKIKEQDGASVAFLRQLRTTLNRFATRFPGPILAIGAFAGIRMAELDRLDLKAVDLEWKFIEIRAGQAKAASRRVIPISDNLAAWLTPLERKGKIVRTKELQTHAPALARALKMEWPCNVLRDSFISYRIAIVQSADQVAHEVGNSAYIIFKHYRELTTPEVAEKCFSILPKGGQWKKPSATTARSDA